MAEILPRSQRGGGGLSWATFRTPWGEGLVSVADGSLVEVDLPDPATGTCPGAHRRREGVPSSTLDRWVAGLEGYFRTGHPQWEDGDAVAQVESLDTTPFRRAVYRALVAVPPGKTVSYGELARLAGHPGAARAVGTAMAENPLALVVPCHRVVRSDGSPGRYGRCDACKPELLDLERAGREQPDLGLSPDDVTGGECE